MKLHDIRTTIERIASIDKTLTREKLEMMLNASGWQKSDILDGLFIWDKELGGHVSDDVVQTETASTAGPETNLPIVAEEHLPSDKTETFALSETPGMSGIETVPGGGAKVRTFAMRDTNPFPVDLPVAPEHHNWNTAPYEIHKTESHIETMHVHAENVASYIPKPPVQEPVTTPASAVPIVEETRKISLEAPSIPPVALSDTSTNDKVALPQEKGSDSLYIILSTVLSFLILMLLLGYMYTIGKL
jgi:hypothetical protein